ncbi:MAG TPA: hypothetical protein VG345_12485 [Bryobacteraceae bacterium]|jgi:hypothetical protein|nr:hypothetical protein [Bryobacteraceae bacterium]
MAYQITDQVGVADADREAALAALDYTCRYYLDISAAEFMRKWDSGEISAQIVKKMQGFPAPLICSLSSAYRGFSHTESA